jgi:hypothetical protein
MVLCLSVRPRQPVGSVSPRAEAKWANTPSPQSPGREAPCTVPAAQTAVNDKFAAEIEPW